jgi:hypothetical protein
MLFRRASAAPSGPKLRYRTTGEAFVRNGEGSHFRGPLAGETNGRQPRCPSIWYASNPTPRRGTLGYRDIGARTACHANNDLHPSQRGPAFPASNEFTKAVRIDPSGCCSRCSSQTSGQIDERPLANCGPILLYTHWGTQTHHGTAHRSNHSMSPHARSFCILHAWYGARVATGASLADLIDAGELTVIPIVGFVRPRFLPLLVVPTCQSTDLDELRLLSSLPQSALT